MASPLQTHVKCRAQFYPRTQNQVQRFPVPDDKVPWLVQWDAYKPHQFTASHLKGQTWADPEIGKDGFHPNFNCEEKHVNRKSHMGDYTVINGFPLNPMGRTGLVGRGVLGRWGPNHAADPITTRWLRDGQGHCILNRDTQRPILEFVGIQRKDSGEWALPGGMVDPGEESHQTALREFLEEAMDAENLSSDQLQQLKSAVDRLFANGRLVYSGYVDDPRNTDNSWMETTAINYHADADEMDALPFRAGSDAKNVAWLEVSSKLNLYASHAGFLKLVADFHQAHW